MNSDLRRRLKQFDKLTQKEWEFLDAIEARFVEETTVKWVTICYEPIESDDDDTAYTDYNGEFQIVLDNRLQFGTILDYLLHEFAHIGTWFVNEKDDHGPIFGVEWARLYRIYLQLYAEWFN